MVMASLERICSLCYLPPGLANAYQLDRAVRFGGQLTAFQATRLLIFPAGIVLSNFVFSNAAVPVQSLASRMAHYGIFAVPLAAIEECLDLFLV